MLVTEQIVKEKFPGATMTKELNDGLYYVLDLGDRPLSCSCKERDESEDTELEDDEDILGCETNITFIEDEEGLDDFSGPKEGDHIIHYDNLEVLGIGDTREEAWRDALYSLTSLN